MKLGPFATLTFMVSACVTEPALTETVERDGNVVFVDCYGVEQTAQLGGPGDDAENFKACGSCYVSVTEDCPPPPSGTKEGIEPNRRVEFKLWEVDGK
jgi:hypothetical protein